MPEQVSRPFDAGRDGMVYGEGAAALVLESRQHAEARRAKIFGHIAGFACAFEACTPGQPFHGHAIRTAITQTACATAGLIARRRRTRQRARAEHGRTRSGRGAGDSRHAGRRAGHRAEEFLRKSGGRHRRRGIDRQLVGSANRPGPFTLQLRASRPALSHQRGPKNCPPTSPCARRSRSIRHRWASRWRWSSAANLDASGRKLQGTDTD